MRIIFKGSLRYARQILQGEFEREAGLSNDFNAFLELLSRFPLFRLFEFSGDVELPDDIPVKPKEDWFHPTMRIIERQRKRPKIFVGISRLKPEEQSPDILVKILLTVIEGNYLKALLKLRPPSWRQRRRYGFSKGARVTQIPAALPISFKPQPNFRHNSFQVFENEEVILDQRKGSALGLLVYRGKNGVYVVEIHLSAPSKNSVAYSLANRIADTVPRFNVQYSYFVLGEGWQTESVHEAWKWEIGEAHYL